MNSLWLKRLHVVLAVFATAYAFLACLRTIGDFDTGWQLATGRYLLQHHTIPTTDVLSFTTHGAPWLYPPFAGAILYLVYAGSGYAGLSWICAVAAALLAAYLLSRWNERLGVTSTLLILAVPSLAYRITPRADLFTTLLFAILLTELWRLHLGERVQLWLVPVIMLLWVNLHPGFIAGLALIAAYVIAEVSYLPFADLRGSAVRRLSKSWPWLVAGVAATLANPFGTAVYGQALALAGVRNTSAQPAPTHFVGELSAAPISWSALRQTVALRDPDSSFWWLLILAILCVVLAVRKRELGAALVLAVSAYAAVGKLRYQGLFAIVVIVIGGALLADLIAELNERAKPNNKRSLAWIVAALALVICAFTAVRAVDVVSNRTYVISSSTSTFGTGESWWFPERASAFIDREHLTGNIFQPYNLGGFTALRLGPQYLDYSDGRGVSGAMLDEQTSLLSQPPDSPAWREVAAQRNLNVALLSLARFGGLGGFDLNAYCKSSEWRPVYMDEVSLVLLRRTPQNEPLLKRLEVHCETLQLAPPADSASIDRYEFFANYGSLLYALARDNEAEAAYKQALELQPADPNLHLYLAQLYQQQQRLSDAEREYREALTRRESAEAWYALGRMLAGEHRYQESEGAIAKSARMTPTPANNYKALAQVQLRLNKPQPALENFRRAERSQVWGDNSLPVAREFHAQIAEGRAEAARQIGDIGQALELQQEATRQTPQSSERWKKLSELAANAGNRELAESAARQANELHSAAQPR
ncbi:MAG TPA: tetratricopeptide repeat protein [candidate division Zixibacteria bacterium]|nr:tetratricopeptide repeat protein [candidate division Zixibacteria bacterium]